MSRLPRIRELIWDDAGEDSVCLSVCLSILATRISNVGGSAARDLWIVFLLFEGGVISFDSFASHHDLCCLDLETAGGELLDLVIGSDRLHDFWSAFGWRFLFFQGYLRFQRKPDFNSLV
jgi:hypothetical protein